MREKPKVGQKLWHLNIGNAARHREQKLTSTTVTRVGRQYFYCLQDIYAGSPHMETRYHLSTWGEASDYSSNSKLYASEQEYSEQQTVSGICDTLGEIFKFGHNTRGLSIVTLTSIMKLIEEDK